MNRLWIRVRPVRAVALVALLAGCGSPVGDLAGRWQVVEVNDVPVAESPAVRLGLPDDPDSRWIEERLVSRTIEIFEDEREFLDRTVATIVHQSAADAMGDPEARPIVRTEIVDTVLISGTVEAEGDSIRFRATPAAGVISHSRSDARGASAREYRRSIPLSILGSDSAYVLVGRREGDRLRLRGPDGTDYTFGPAESASRVEQGPTPNEPRE